MSIDVQEMIAVNTLIWPAELQVPYPVHSDSFKPKKDDNMLICSGSSSHAA
jgi:hypothetical protein